MFGGTILQGVKAQPCSGNVHFQRAQLCSYPLHRKDGGDHVPTVSVKCQHHRGSWLQPSYSCSGLSLMASLCKASGEAETSLWCRCWYWPPPHQLDCSSSSQEKQPLAKVMRWCQTHCENTVWATFIIPHCEPRFHERGSLDPLDNLNHF